MPRAVLLHYDEIGLKGGNRAFFERALLKNAEAATAGVVRLRFQRLPGRHLADLPEGVDLELLSTHLKRLFGCASFSFPYVVEPTFEAVAEAARTAIQEAPGGTFAVRAKTAHTKSGLRAQQLHIDLGTFLIDAGAGRVDLSNPDRTLRVEVVGERALVYARKFAGPRGLPVGTAGKVATLLSAGLDSPIAALRLMNRGARSHMIHFHSQPYTDGSSVRNTMEIAEILTRYQGRTHIALVPLAPSQQAIVAHCPEELRTILYRRQMMRIASRLAKKAGIKALVTGDSLGQVASQTLENIAAVEAAATLPVLRPLIGDDKVDIVHASRAHGLFEPSTAPCQEACVLFEPRKPATRTSNEVCLEAEAGLDLEALVNEALEATEVRRIGDVAAW